MTKLKRLLKRYEKARKKASNLYEKIVKVYEEAYMQNDVRTTGEIYYSLYSNTLTKRIERALHNSHYGLTNYADTDSVKDNRGRNQNIIYSDFDKKREV